MKIFWLTPVQFAYAFGIGVLLAGVVIFASAPHPVSVPVQVITPVPTPPPVVITQHPAPDPIQSAPLTVYETNQVLLEVINSMWGLMFPLATIAAVLTVLNLMVRR